MENMPYRCDSCGEPHRDSYIGRTKYFTREECSKMYSMYEGRYERKKDSYLCFCELCWPIYYKRFETQLSIEIKRQLLEFAKNKELKE